MTSRVRFSVGLVFVAIGATTFAIAFRASLSWFYRAVYDADSVVAAIANDHGRSVLHERDEAVGRPEVDADDLAHSDISRSMPASRLLM